ncbi:MAG TPA: polynucleotide adenylyltransferase [Opitutaceae bacterium]|nr:polynucleotide adenylyltransferase [Opitutaceae bacterium]
MRADLPLPADLRAMLEAARKVGRPRLVGGGVRDWLLGLESKDFDVEVAGVDFERLQAALAPFGATDVVGRSFGVIKVRSSATGAEYDFSLPRRESKTGAGHRGFAVRPEPGLSDAEAAARRDFTVNAIAWDPFSGQLIDPHGGQADLKARVLRHTSAAFTEDPLRVLRAFQLAARFGFSLAPETAALCRSIAGTFSELPVERVWGEWDKWAVKSALPSRGLAVLEETGWLRHFPEIAALRGTPQEPEWHPEGDVFTHTQLCLDALAGLEGWKAAAPAQRRRLSLAVLAHDFGKPATTVRAEKRGALRWISPGHEPAGGPLAEAFLRRIGAPLELAAPVTALVVHHLIHHHGSQGGFSDAQVRRLARKLVPASIDELALVMTADSLGRPPLQSPETLVLIDKLRGKARQLELADAAPKPLMLGRHLMALGRRPGPDFKPLLEAAFEAQLDGAFADEAGGLAWLRAHLP